MRGMRARELFVWILVGFRKILGVLNDRSLNQSHHNASFISFRQIGKRKHVPIILCSAYISNSFLHALHKEEKKNTKKGKGNKVVVIRKEVV